MGKETKVESKAETKAEAKQEIKGIQEISAEKAAKKAEKNEKEIKSIQDLPGIGQQAAEKLLSAGYKTLEAMAVASPMELIEVAGLGQITAEKAVKAARDALEMGFETADKLAEKRKHVGRITTGSKEVDALIGGGIESLPPEEEIFVVNNGCLERKPIGEVVEEAIKESNVIQTETETIVSRKNDKGINALAFDGNYKIKQKKITAFVKHKRTEKVLEIKIGRGKRIAVTEGHSLFKLDGTRVAPAKAKELQPGDFVAVPKKIWFENDLPEMNLIQAFSSTEKKWLTRIFAKTPKYVDFLFKSYSEEIKNSIKKESVAERFFFDWRYANILPLTIIRNLPQEAFATETLKRFSVKIGADNLINAIIPLDEQTMWLLGFAFAECGTTILSPQIGICQEVNNTQALERTQTIMLEKIGTSVPIFDDSRTDSKQKKIVSGNTALWLFFKAVGLGKYSYEKRLPSFVFGLEKEKISAFLQGYFEGDGVKKRDTIGWTTSSAEMAKDIMALLTALGETPVHITTKNKEPKYKKMHTIYAFQLKDISQLGKNILERQEKNILPVKEIILAICRENKLSFKLKKFYCQAEVNNPTVKTIKVFCTEARKYCDSEKIGELEKLAESDLLFEKVLSIGERDEQPEFVFDIQTLDNPVIDNFITGSLVCAHNTQSITEVYGKFASSKSQWCFETAVTVQLPKEKGGLEGNCLYIDSENSFRPERIISIAKHFKLDPEKVLRNIFVARAFNADHQMLLAEKAADLIKEKNIKLMIVDSLTAQFRGEFIGRGMLADRQQRLNKHMHTLMKLAEMNNIAVLVTNQVMQRPDILFGDPTAPIGGEIVAHNSKTRIYLRKSKADKRVAKLVDSPSLPDGEAIFRVTENGIEDVKD